MYAHKNRGDNRCRIASALAEIGQILRTDFCGQRSYSSIDTWLQCGLLVQFSMHFFVGHGIFCLLYFLLLVVVGMRYAL